MFGRDSLPLLLTLIFKIYFLYIYIYVFTTIGLINTLISHYIITISFFFVVRTFKILSILRLKTFGGIQEISELYYENKKANRPMCLPYSLPNHFKITKDQQN